MSLYRRELRIDLPQGQSAFLWGPRKVGKSTLLAEQFPGSARFDLLETRTLIQFTREPWAFAEQVMALPDEQRRLPIIVDEAQKAPAILDEVHRLIETEGLAFVLCGSSARKLKRGGGNLLGGRAWRFHLHPLTWRELPEFDLLRALNRGLVPTHYDSTQYRRALAGYGNDYLKEEVFDEGLTRNVAAFSRFFDALGFSHGEILNFSSLARDCGVDSKTVREYFQILEDTLPGRHDRAVRTPPFARDHHPRPEVLSVRCRRGRLPHRPPDRAAGGFGLRTRPRTLHPDGTARVPQLPGSGLPHPVLANQIRFGGGFRCRPNGTGRHRGQGRARSPARHEGHPRVRGRASARPGNHRLQRTGRSPGGDSRCLALAGFP